ncbi:MAG: hypothetical protein DRO52_05250, partial [Candidatus Hecatellales archaeon]
MKEMVFALALLDVDLAELEDLKAHLGRVFPVRCFTILRLPKPPEKAYSPLRRQYNSTRILSLLEV